MKVWVWLITSLQKKRNYFKTPKHNNSITPSLFVFLWTPKWFMHNLSVSTFHSPFFIQRPYPLIKTHSMSLLNLLPAENKLPFKTPLVYILNWNTWQTIFIECTSRIRLTIQWTHYPYKSRNKEVMIELQPLGLNGLSPFDVYRSILCIAKRYAARRALTKTH